MWKTILREYDELHRPYARAELERFESLRSLRAAIRQATVPRQPDGRKFPHQRRLPVSVLKEAGSLVASAEPSLRRCRSFEELHKVIERLVLPLRGIGELYCYDTALRIAAYRRLMPEVVHVHCGTREGAKALKLPVSRAKILTLQQLPAALRNRAAYEIEDILCIFKDRFTGFCGRTNPCGRRGAVRYRESERASRCE